MLDRIGTTVGFMVGMALIIFGITWPDHLSNYYVFQISEFEESITEAKAKGATRAEIKSLEDEFKTFKDSWAAGITRFLDLKSILIVLGGAYAATLIAFPLGKAMKTFFLVFTVFQRERGDEEFETVYNSLLEFGDLRYRKQLIPDAEVEEVPIYFLRDAVNSFIQVDWVSEEMVNEIITSQIENYTVEENQDIAVMEYMGRVAPAFGMLGTVVGLILLLGRAAGESSSIAGIMGGMSVALITTLYGVLLAQLIFLPVSAKLHRHKESYIRLYEMIREGVIYLHRRERPDVMEQDLIIYLSKRRRLKLMQERKEAMARGELNL